MIIVLILYALLAATFSLGKALVLLMHPLFVIGIRMLTAGALLLLAYGMFHTKKRIEVKDMLLLGLTSFIHILIPYLSEFAALRDISPSDACLAYNLSPFFSALFSYWIFKEYMTAKKWLGFGMALASLLVYLWYQHALHVHLSWSYVWILISVMSSCLGWILVRMLVKNNGYSPFLVNGMCMLIAGFGSMGYGLATHETTFLLGTLQSSWFWVLMSLSIIIANGLFYNMYGYLLKKYTATFLSFVGFITPLFASLFEWLLFGTVPEWSFFICLGVIAGGIYIFYQEELKQGYIAQ